VSRPGLLARLTSLLATPIPKPQLWEWRLPGAPRGTCFRGIVAEVRPLGPGYAVRPVGQVDEEGYHEGEREDGDYGGSLGSDVPALGFPDPGFSGPATLGATAPRGSGPRVGLSGGSIMGYDASRPVQAPAPAILCLGPPYRSRPCLSWGPTLSTPPFWDKVLRDAGLPASALLYWSR